MKLKYTAVNQRVREPDPEAPYAAVSSTPTNPEPGKPVRIDATECVDKKGNPCKNFVFDFGDGSPPVQSTNPVVNHVYSEPGTYPVNVTCTDRYGKKGNASLNQRIKDPKKPFGPPYANLQSKPKETQPYEPIVAVLFLTISDIKSNITEKLAGHCSWPSPLGGP